MGNATVMEKESWEKDIAVLDYSSKEAQILLREFGILLHEVNTNYEMTIARLENEHKYEIHELKTLLKHYENNNISSAKVYKIRITIIAGIKSLIIAAVRLLFRVSKKVIVALGIKEQLKNTRVYKKLCSSGIVDKLKGRV